MSAKVALGIFWDIENCAVPLIKSASSVAKNLRDFIAAAHPECGYAKEFFCVCDTRKMDQHLLEGLDKNGVVVVHVLSTAKNAADDKLQELIDMFVDKYGQTGSAVLCIITGDINFAKPIRNARRKDLDVLLIHGQSCSADLKNLVNESYLYEDIIKGADNVAKVDNQLKPGFLEVMNLPTEQTLGGILGRLSVLSANCGGKPELISNGKGFIRFGCKDDAQRCLQRIDGQTVFGNTIQVRLFDGEPKALKAKRVVKQRSVEQTTGPTAAKLNKKTLSQQNLPKNVGKSATDLTKIQSQTPDGDDCRSVIIGLHYGKSIDLKKSVQDLITSWNDKKLKPDLIKMVQGGKFSKASGTGMLVADTLHVLAITPEANKLLVFRSKKYLKDSGIKWFFKTQPKAPTPQQNQSSTTSAATSRTTFAAKENKIQNINGFVDNDRKSVIKGVDTKKDDNVAKIVRKLVESWADKAVHPNYIKTVERDKKYADKDGVVLLFVTAHSSENSQALVAAANRYMKPTDPISWTAYRKRKRNASKDTDTESNISESFEFIPSAKSSTLDLSAKPTVQKSVEVPITDEFLSVITGLETKKGENVAKVVRRVIFDWKNPKLNGNLIKTVDRFPDFPDVDGKIPLLVTAINPQACLALLAGAEQYLDSSNGILWAHFKSDSTSVASRALNGMSADPLLNTMISPNQTFPQSKIKPFDVKQDVIDNGPMETPRTASVDSFVPPQIQIFNNCPVMPIQSIPTTVNPRPIVKRDNLVANHCNQSNSSANPTGEPIMQSLQFSGPKPNPHYIPQDFRRDVSDKNLFKSIITGFESLFKSSKTSPKKSEPKALDSDMTSESYLRTLTPIYGPKVPFSQFFIEGLDEGFTLCISGRLNTSADCFSIDFIDNTDIALHFNVRIALSVVVRNSRIKGEWGPEEREIPSFPFFEGSRFELIIRVKRDRYVIAVNRQHFCDYEHRIAFRSVRKLSIAGNISIDCIRSAQNC